MTTGCTDSDMNVHRSLLSNTRLRDKSTPELLHFHSFVYDDGHAVFAVLPNKISCEGACTLRPPTLFIETEGEKDGSCGDKLGCEQKLNALHDTKKLILAIARSTSPHKSPIENSSERRMSPCRNGSFRNWDDILVSKQQSWFQGRIRSLPSVYESMSIDFINIQVLMN